MGNKINDAREGVKAWQKKVDAFIHIKSSDHQGFSGNLSDMLVLHLKNPENFEKKQDCIENMKMKVLLVPPEHRACVGTLLKQMAALT
jgi:hypothetical protein